MSKLFWVLIILRLVLHQDFWFWDSDYLVAGIIPIGLAYHIGISIAATFTWLAIAIFSWPEDLQDQATVSSENG